jgi:hypothetical protein
MRMSRRGWANSGRLALGLFLGAAGLRAQVDVPLSNWTVPPYTASSAGGIHTMTDVTSPRAFIGIQPCRVADTRGNGAPIQGGIFANSESRNWMVWGICGIPSGADAISVNFTVVSPAGTPLGAFLLAWPTGQAPPPTAIMTYGPGATVISNAAIVPLSAAGQLTVNVSNSTHILMDVNGYFSDTVSNSAEALALTNNFDGGPAAVFINISTAGRSEGVAGRGGPAFTTPSYTVAGVRGESVGAGVLGISKLYEGVNGSVVDNSGSELAFGILGFHSNVTYPPELLGSNLGVIGETYGSKTGSTGVVGYAGAVTGTTYGVLGVTLSPSDRAVGVRGIDGTGSAACLGCPFFSAGVRGESFGHYGVEGVSSSIAVAAFHIDVNGTIQTSAYLGSGSTQGLYVSGDSLVTGNKSFVEPHPTDATKIIRYISLEGNESGTYFRGRGKFQNGLARIPVPEDFRIVTDPEGLTVQVTPIGAMATVAVMKMNLEEIVVQSSRDVEFSYMVNGIRQAYKDAGPIAENDGIFVPMSPDAPMIGSYPPVIRQRLISNGTYNANGTVNMETARRLGWDKIWEERSRPAPQPTEP